MQMVNPIVYLDVCVNDNVYLGRLVIELFADLTPKTAENFRVLCTCELGYGYKNTVFHRIIPEFMCQGGDLTHNNGTGGRSIYGPNGGFFEDENFLVKHSQAGIVSMVNSGPNKNQSQFFITTGPSPWFDGKNVAFGRVIEGMEVLKRIESFGTTSGIPTRNVFINDCGQLN